MKKVLLMMVAAFSATMMSAQLPNGSIAPNFTSTDINGDEHTMYDYLDMGYYVILDVSATWCGPCWSYHTSGVLEGIYEAHGPDGDQTIMVFMIEGDPTTNTDCLYGSTGCNSSTQGDWVTGTPYPIIDDNTIADAYAITYYPSTFLICPSRVIIDSESIQPSESTIMNFLDQCVEATENNDPAILATTVAGATCDNPDVTLTVVLQNFGLQPLTSATIEVLGGASTVTENWSGNLDTYETANVVIDVPMNGSATLTVHITSADDNASNSMISFNAGVAESTTHVHIEYATDEWPEEFTWEIINENGNVVEDGGPYSTGTGPQDPVSGELDLYLPATGCYEFVAYDAFGDGLYGSQWGGTDGYIQVYGVDLGGGDMDLWYNYNGSYNYSEDRGYGDATVLTVSENEFVSQLSAFPNPTSTVATVNYTLSQGGNVSFEVVNMIGETVGRENLGNRVAGNHTHELNLSALSAGVYMVNVNCDGNVSTLRVTVK